MKFLMILSFVVISFLGNAQTKAAQDSCLTIPNSISKANGSELKIGSICDLMTFKLQIYNRWGNLMYSADEFKESFDLDVDTKTGKKKQIERFSSGVYFWVISYKVDDGSDEKSLQGSINIL